MTQDKTTSKAHVRDAIAEAQLRESEALYRTLFDNAPIGLGITTEHGELIAYNSAMLERGGYTRQDIEVLSNVSELYADGAEQEAVMRMVAEQGSVHEYPVRFKRKDGGSYDTLLSVVPVTIGGKPHFQALVEDVSEKKRLEQRLRLVGVITEQVCDSVIATNLDFEIVYVNRAFRDLFGYTTEEVLGRSADMLNAEQLADDIQKDIYETVVAGVPWRETLLNRRKDGSTFVCDLVVSPLADENGEIFGYAGTQRDITAFKQAEQERLDLETQVQQARKLESLGILAGGIAHDFNNLLMGVLGNAELALTDLSSDSPARVSIERIQAAGKRASQLADQMLAYSGKGRFVVEPVRLSDVVREMEHLLADSVTEVTVLTFELESAIPPVSADVAQIRHAVMSLVANAVEALEGQQGLVKIATGVMAWDEASLSEGLTICRCPEGRYSYVEVSDTGVGMDGAIIDKSFDPFFTTKFTGRGLGLAALFGIVRGHNGGITVASEPGKGTTVRILFPVFEMPEASAGDSGEVEAGTADGGIILLVDDDPAVLDIGARLLKMAGYEVQTACDGQEAIGLFRDRAQDFKCVILDLTMPNMNGDAVFIELQKVRNDVPVLLSSGYSVAAVEGTISTHGFAGFIKKPYKLNELMKAVRGALST